MDTPQGRNHRREAVPMDTKTKSGPTHETTDVLVVGSGFAGLAAAISAAEGGASVLVIEKNRYIGGNSRISDGGVAAPQTDLQRRFGYDDSPELFYRDIMRSGLGLNHERLVRVLVDGARDAFLWSRDELGVPYLDRVDIFGGHSVHRCYTADKVTGATIIARLSARLTELGVEVRKETRLDRLLRANRGAGVSGAVVCGAADGAPRRITAKRGIVLATGGYGADVRFRSAQDPRLGSAVDTTNRATATAEALKEALRTGAMPVQLGAIQLGPWASPDEKGYGRGPMFSEYVVFPYGIVVDSVTGERFVNELTDRKRLSDAILQRGRPAIAISDAHAVQTGGWDIGPAVRKGVVRRFASIGELASAYGPPADTLEATIVRYNRAVELRADEDFGKPIVADAAPIATPPFHAMRLWPKVHHVSGGIGIDENARVVDLDGRPISGLFAAGEVTGGVHGANRLGSCAITECLVFGRIAGRNAAKR